MIFIDLIILSLENSTAIIIILFYKMSNIQLAIMQFSPVFSNDTGLAAFD